MYFSYLTLYSFFFRFISPQFFITSKTDIKLLPSSVSVYSTRGGTSLKSWRLIKPSASNSRSCFVNDDSVISRYDAEVLRTYVRSVCRYNKEFLFSICRLIFFGRSILLHIFVWLVPFSSWLSRSFFSMIQKIHNKSKVHYFNIVL